MFLLDILIFLAVLSLLIFFHELGHFVAAKACGIYCDRFSLGMPPRVWGFRWGETDYCIGALPIGGFVKMAGQEDVPQSEEKREDDYSHVPPERWFKNRPVWQRFIVILAGPMMNLVLAILLYGIVAGLGARVPLREVDNRIGEVQPGSPAATAPLYRAEDLRSLSGFDFSGTPDATGWRTGDRIVFINGEEIDNIGDVLVGAVLGGDEMLVVELERQTADGLVRYLSPVKPEVLDDTGHARFGVTAYETALVRYTMAGTPAREHGIQAGDIIVRANGEPVDAATFTQFVSDFPPGKTIHIELERNGERITVGLTPQIVGRIRDVSFSPPLHLLIDFDESEPISLEHVSEGLAQRTGLAQGDILRKIDGEPATSEWIRQLRHAKEGQSVHIVFESRPQFFGLLGDAEIKEADLPLSDLVCALTGIDDSAAPRVVYVAEDARERTGLLPKDILLEVDGKPATLALLRQIEEERVGETISVKVRRPPILLGLMRRESIETGSLSVAPVGAIGVVWGEKTVFQRVKPVQVVPEAFRLAYRDLERTVRILGRVGTGGVSVRDLGGPLLIFQVTTRAARLGYSWLLKITAYISVSLCVINLFPLPVLDGGWLVFLAIEGVRRKPLNVKVLERIQQVGLVVIIALMLFVTYNDIARWVKTLVP